MKLIDLNGVKVLFDVLMERICVEIYTKAEADGKFQPKGDYFNKTEVVNLIIEIVKSKKKTDGNMKEQEIPFNLKYR